MRTTVEKNNNSSPYEAINDIKPFALKNKMTLNHLAWKGEWIKRFKTRKKNLFAFGLTNNLSNLAINGWACDKSTRPEVTSSADQGEKRNDKYNSRLPR